MGLPVSKEWTTRWLAKTRPERANARFAQYADDAVGFARDIAQVTPWPQMEKLLRLVQEHDSVAVRSGHKCSKSTSAVVLALWFCLTRPGDQTQVIITAPAAHQVEDILWEELRRRLNHIRDVDAPLRAAIGPELGKAPHRGYRLFNGSRILGKSTDKEEKAAGSSAANLFIIIDEASGYPDKLFEAMEGNTAGDAKLLAISNPTKPTGWFADAFKGRSEFETLHISSERTPNALSGERLIPGLATKKWVEKMRRKYGPEPERYREHRVYRVRVMGEFPLSAEDGIISLRNITEAGERWRADGEPQHGPLIIAVDPADYGADDAVIQPLRDLYAYRPKVLTGSVESTDIANEVVKMLRRMRRLPEDETVTVAIDGNGAAGGGCREALRATEAFKKGEFELAVVEGFRKVDHREYSNLRTKLLFEMDDWLREGGAVEMVDELEEELQALKYGYREHDGKLVAELKRNLKKRLGRSPNRADALAIAISCTKSIEWGSDDDYDRDERGAGSFM